MFCFLSPVVHYTRKWLKEKCGLLRFGFSNNMLRRSAGLWCVFVKHCTIWKASDGINSQKQKRLSPCQLQIEVKALCQGKKTHFEESILQHELVSSVVRACGAYKSSVGAAESYSKLQSWHPDSVRGCWWGCCKMTHDQKLFFSAVLPVWAY